MVGTLEPLDGMVKRHNHLRIGQYHQHLTELLDPELSPLEYMMREYKDIPIEKMRSVVSGAPVRVPWGCFVGKAEATMCHAPNTQQQQLASHMELSA
jgi:hypothetical protein